MNILQANSELACSCKPYPDMWDQLAEADLTDATRR